MLRPRALTTLLFVTLVLIPFFCGFLLGLCFRGTSPAPEAGDVRYLPMPVVTPGSEETISI